MQKFTLILLLTIVWRVGFAQAGPILKIGLIDSLKEQLVLARMDTSRTLIMCELASHYKYTHPDSALYFGQKALVLSRKINYPYGESYALANLGFAYEIMGNLPKAFEFHLKGLKVAEKTPRIDAKAFAIERNANIYRKTKNYTKALAYNHRAKKMYDSIQDIEMSIIQLHNICRIYTDMNQLDSALHYAAMTYETAKVHHLEGLYFFNNFGRIYAKKGDFELALHYAKSALIYGQKVKNANTIAAVSLHIAQIYKPLNFDSCIHYAEMSLAYAQEAKLYSSIVDPCTLLAEVYTGKADSKAIHYYKIALAAKDSLSASVNLNALENITVFDEKERQYEIETAQTAYKNKIRQYALLAGLGVFLLIAFILYRNNRQKQKANAVLEKTLSSLKSTQAQLLQSEKLASLGELTAGIAHEIQNPLNFVNNFAEVSAEMLGEMEEELEKGDTQEAKAIAADLKQNLSKINHHGQRASSIVKGMLEHSRASTGVKEPTDLNALADEYLRLAYHGLRAKDNNFNATLETHFDPSIPKIEVIPQDIGRVLVNLINNAFYAVNEKQKQTANATSGTPLSESFRLSESYTPTVMLTTKRLEKTLEIRVQDNGLGVPDAIREKIFQPFFTTKPTGQGTGLGLSLAYDIVVKGHGGNLEVESDEEIGAVFIIRLPIKSNEK